MDLLEDLVDVRRVGLDSSLSVLLLLTTGGRGLGSLGRGLGGRSRSLGGGGS